MNKLLIFKLEQEEYGVSMDYVISVERHIHVVRVPDSSQYIEGILNMRGEVIPAYNLRTRFGLPPQG